MPEREDGKLARGADSHTHTPPPCQKEYMRGEQQRKLPQMTAMVQLEIIRTALNPCSFNMLSESKFMPSTIFG